MSSWEKGVLSITNLFLAFQIAQMEMGKMICHGVVAVQSRRMWSRVLGVVRHKWQEESFVIFLLCSRDLVGRLLWELESGISLYGNVRFGSGSDYVRDEGGEMERNSVKVLVTRLVPKLTDLQQLFVPGKMAMDHAS
nr:hypothetical protein CFP56_78825 [Quercus suber]